MSDPVDCLQGCFADGDAAHSGVSKQRWTLGDMLCSVPGTRFNREQVVLGTCYCFFFCPEVVFDFLTQIYCMNCLQGFVLVMVSDKGN